MLVTVLPTAGGCCQARSHGWHDAAPFRQGGALVTVGGTGCVQAARNVVARMARRALPAPAPISVMDGRATALRHWSLSEVGGANPNAVSVECTANQNLLAHTASVGGVGEGIG